jgi:hypothetical protein
MQISKILFVVLFGVLAIGCKSSQKIVVSNSSLDKMIARQAFKIEVNAAEPMVTTALAQIANSGLMRPGNTMSRIDVTGEGYFVKMDGDSITAYLPYFGERQMGGGYGSDAGIKFDGTARDIEITKDESKNSYEITFGSNDSTESYLFTIDVLNNLNTTVHVRSSHRNWIRYQGKAKELETEDKVLIEK